MPISLLRTQWVSSTIYICALLKACSVFSSAISQIPRLRLLEANVCRSFYRFENSTVISSITDAPPESACKTSEIQGRLTTLLGLGVFFHNIPILLVGLIYIVLSSRINRKLLLFINVTSAALSKIFFYSVCYFYNTFDIRLIWTASLFDFIGGGSIVFDALTVSMIAETVETASLSTVYFYLAAILTVLRMSGVSGGAFMLGLGYWLPIGIGFGAWCMTLPTVLLLDTGECGNYRSLPTDNSLEELDNLSANDNGVDSSFESGLGSDESSISALPKRSGERRKDRNTYLSLEKQPTSHWIGLVRLTLTEVRSHGLPLSVFLTHELAMGVRDVAEQWISNRYILPLQKVGYILAGQTLLSAAVLSLLPKLGAYVARMRELTPEAKDLYVVKASVLVAATGAITIALAWNIPILLTSLAVFAFGAGFHDALKSHIASRVGVGQSAKLTRIYMSVTIIEVFANLINGPLWAAVYTIVLQIGRNSMSLPFLICSLGFLGTWLLTRRLS